MGIGGTSKGKGGQLVLAAGVWLAVFSATADAQFFGNSKSPDTFSWPPPRDVPSVAPPQNSIPPSGSVAPPAAAKGPLLQSPAAANPAAQAHAAPNASAAPVVPPGHGALTVSARFGRDLPTINGGLHLRGFPTEQNGVPRPVQEDKGPAPPLVFPPGAYVVSV